MAKTYSYAAQNAKDSLKPFTFERRAPGADDVQIDPSTLAVALKGFIADDVIDALKTQDSDVRARYDSLSKTGFALSAEGSLYYQISPSTRIGGEASYNTFGSYDELRSTIGIRQSLGATK